MHEGGSMRPLLHTQNELREEDGRSDRTGGKIFQATHLFLGL